MTRYIWLALISILVSTCEREEKFPDLGLSITGPVGAEVSDDGSYFYVLNSDFDRLYNKGSILVIKEDGSKVRAIETSRMGRSISVAGSRMIVTYDAIDGERGPQVELYDVTDPSVPVLKRTFPINCSPLNATQRKGYDHFAVTCSGGGLLVGTFATDLAGSELKHVRDYGRTRRAMYIDPKREVLFAFVTDMGRQTTNDVKADDRSSFSDEGEVEGANEIPDFMENKKSQRRRRAQRFTYQYVIYPIGSERDAGFPYRRLTTEANDVADLELRWLYFTLNNAEGWPDSNEEIRDIHRKNYRTNIWEARPNPFDDDSFYISHRGFKDSEHANNIVQVSIVGDLTDTAAPTSSILDFERVYGFNGEVTNRDYPGDFRVVPVGGQPVLVVNHFRDLVYWKAEDQEFSLAAKVIGQGFWFTRLPSVSHEKSYYQIALNRQGRGISLSFYGSRVLLLDVVPGTAITEVKQIF